MSGSALEALASLPLEDDQPRLGAASGGVVVEDEPPYTQEYIDVAAYASKWSAELEVVTRAETIIASGNEIVQRAYLYRSVAATMPSSGETDIAMGEKALIDLHRAQHKALEPNMRILKDMMRFVADSRAFFKSCIAEPEKRFTDVLAMRLLEIIDLNVICDRLKALRNSYQIDHSVYKLAVEYITHKDGFTPPGDDSELALFLPRGTSIINVFKVEIIRLEKSQGALYQLVETCLDHLDKGEFISAFDRFQLLRALPNLLYFLDHSDDPRNSLLRRKEINLSKIVKHLKKAPVVPLIGDMTYFTLNILRESPSFHGKEGMEYTVIPTKSKLAAHYDIASTLENVRSEHNTFTAMYKTSLSKLTSRQEKDLAKGDVRDAEALKASVDFRKLTLRGIALLTEWSSDLFSLFAFKFAFPFDDDVANFKLYEDRKDTLDEEPIDGDPHNPSSPTLDKKDNAPAAASSGDPGLSTLGSASPSDRRVSLLPDTNVGAIRAKSLIPDSKSTLTASSAKASAELYERAVKYNFTSRERFAVVEYIGMIKGLAQLLLSTEEQALPLVLQAMHDQLQEFVIGPIRDFLRRISKKEQNPMIIDLVQFMDSVVDWKGKVPREDPALRAEKDPLPRPVLTRRVGPTATQSALIRSVLWGYLNLRGKGLMYSSKDFDTGHVKDKVFEEMYHSAFFYPALSNLAHTIRRVTDLSDLWLREYHLELSGSVQFPIHMSIPWLLTDHILESVDMGHAATDYLLYPMSIYGDASFRALYSLKSKYLFEEVEAEVSLAFEQLLFKLTDIVYGQYKMQAASIALDKNFKSSMHSLAGVGAVKMRQLTVPLMRLTPLLHQRHFSLIGRTIDLSRLLSQRLNKCFLDNVHFAITRFESANIMGIVALERLLYNIRLTHYLMSQHVRGLDSFEKIFAQVNETVSMTSFHGRIELHIVYELMTDLCGFSAFNSTTQRFVRTQASVAFREPMKRVSAPKNKVQFLYGNKALTASYAAVDSLYEKYFGYPHAKSIVRVIGPASLPLIVSEVLKNAKVKLGSVLLPYFNEVRNGLPDRIALPMHEYGAEGVYGVFYGKFRNLIDYGALVSHLFRHIAEWGNLLVVLKLLDTALSESNTLRLVQASSFLGVRPVPRVPGQPRAPLEVPASTPLDRAFFTLSTTMQFSESVKGKNLMGSYLQNTRLIGQHYLPPKENYSLFKFALSQIQEMVINSEGLGQWSAASGKVDSDVLPVEMTNEFHRIWSSLLFVFCVDVKDNMALSASSLELFGDGFAWCGAVILHFLNQRNRFGIFDFTWHTLKTNEVVQNLNEAMRPFFIRVAQLREITNSVFAVMEGLFPIPLQKVEDIRVFEPPSKDEKPTTQQYLHKAISIVPKPLAASTSSVGSSSSLGSNQPFAPDFDNSPTSPKPTQVSSSTSSLNPYGSTPLPPSLSSSSGLSARSPTSFGSAPSPSTFSALPFPDAPDPTSFFDLPPAPSLPDEAAPPPPDLGEAPLPPTFDLGEAPSLPLEDAPLPPVRFLRRNSFYVSKRKFGFRGTHGSTAASFDDWDPFNLRNKK